MLKNILFVLLVWSLVIVVFFLGFTAIRRQTVHETISYTVERNQPMVAITFDDGPNAAYTPQLLGILSQHQTPATFFVVGENVAKHPRLLKAMVQEGHELANHSYHHRDFTTLSPKEVKAELDTTEAEVQKVLPSYRLPFVRPPYGHYNKEVLRAFSVPMVLWHIDSGDWQKKSAAQIYHTVIAQVKDGDIIVFHDDNQGTIDAVNKLIPVLEKRGFQAVTLTELQQHRELTP